MPLMTEEMSVVALLSEVVLGSVSSSEVTSDGAELSSVIELPVLSRSASYSRGTILVRRWVLTCGT